MNPKDYDNYSAFLNANRVERKCVVQTKIPAQSSQLSGGQIGFAGFEGQFLAAYDGKCGGVLFKTGDAEHFIDWATIADLIFPNN